MAWILAAIGYIAAACLLGAWLRARSDIRILTAARDGLAKQNGVLWAINQMDDR
jgi:hypothetical protein